VPVTVLSRCLQFSLRNMTPQQVAGHLAHVLQVENVPHEAPLALLGRAAAGSMRDALSLLDQAIAYGMGEVKEDGVRAMLGAVDRRYLFVLLDALAAGDGPRLMAEAEQLAQRGIGFDSVLAEMAVLLQQLAMAQTVPTAIADDEPEREALFALASLIAPQDVQLYYQIAIHGRKDLALAPDEHAGFNMTCCACWPSTRSMPRQTAAAPRSNAAAAAHRPAPAVAPAAVTAPSRARMVPLLPAPCWRAWPIASRPAVRPSSRLPRRPTPTRNLRPGLRLSLFRPAVEPRQGR
jgi:DNA polymerase-3 subunit gamma/tau